MGHDVLAFLVQAIIGGRDRVALDGEDEPVPGGVVDDPFGGGIGHRGAFLGRLVDGSGGPRVSVSTGVAVRSPNWVESRLSWERIGMPITPNIVHTAKHAVKAQVVANSTDRLDFAILAPLAVVRIIQNDFGARSNKSFGHPNPPVNLPMGLPPPLQ